MFDFDRTLVTLPVDIDSLRLEVQAVMASVGLKGPARPMLRVLRQLRERGGDACGAKAESLVARAEAKAAMRAQAMPGLGECLGALAGERWGVVTNNSKACVGLALTQLGLPLPDAVVGRDSVKLPKPNPEGLFAVATLLDVEEMFFVGDSASDEEAATRVDGAGGLSCEFFGVGNDYGGATLVDAMRRWTI